MSRVSLFTIDTHTEGEPTRILFWNFPKLPVSNIVQARDYIRKYYDWLRRVILYEPRGHKDMFGVIILPAFSEEADYALVFMDTNGYLDMCGHAVMGVTTALIELGYIEIKKPLTIIKYETPAGIVKAKAQVAKGKVREITVVDVPSFYVKTISLEISKPSRKVIEVDIAFGGNFYALVNARDLGIEVDIKNIRELIDIALHIRSRVNEEVYIQHPEKPYINKVALTMISDKPKNPKAHAKSIVVFAQGSVDRSPCGTGTAAKVSVLYAKGLLGIGDEFVHESIIGTFFKCKVIAETQVGPYKAVIPEITGRAWVTQMSHVVVNEDDPLKYGFIL